MRILSPIALPGTIAAACLALNERVSAWLEFDRAAIGRGQVWRLITCHFTHWSISHVIWSGGMFLLLATLCDIRSRRRAGGVVGFSAILISLGIFLFLPAIQHYRGLSGIDSALYALLAVELLRESGALPRRLLVAGGLGAFQSRRCTNRLPGCLCLPPAPEG